MAIKAADGGITDFYDLDNFGFYADEILVVSGNNEIYTYEGNDVIHLHRAVAGTSQVVYAGAGDDTVNGGASNDFVYDGSGNDRITLGEGADQANLGAGNDVIDGGGGVDGISFYGTSYDGTGPQAANTIGVTFDLAITTAQNLGPFGVDTITGFEDVMGGGGADTLYGSAANNDLFGGYGNDKLYGRAGDDRLFGDAGDDLFDGGPGADLIYGNGASRAADGFDTVTYATSAAGVTINLAGDAGVGGDAAGDRIYKVEKLIGSNFNDILGGGVVNSTIEGLGGNDQIHGGIGNNIIDGGAGNDTINGDPGADYINGSDGSDAVTYASSAAGVTINLYGDLGAGGDALGDRVTNVEKLTGSDFDDVLGGGILDSTIEGLGGNDYIAGGIGHNKIYGGSGNDTIIAGDGNDLVDGGGGNDTLSGGSGSDVFSFTFGPYYSLSPMRNVITDFQHLTDDIDLSTMDASLLQSGDNAFVWNGAGTITTSSAGELRYQQFDNAGTASDYTLVYGDTDADTAAEFQIELTGLVTLTADDFLL
jgi:Ca2+-binding RTX toxin-like protein